MRCYILLGRERSDEFKCGESEGNLGGQQDSTCIGPRKRRHGRRSESKTLDDPEQIANS